MATLGKATPRGARPSTASVDFSGVSRAFDNLAQGAANYAAVGEKARAEEADRWADERFAGWRTENDARMVAAGETYDGKAPGLTQGQLAATDQAFSPLLADEADPVRREALQRRFDGYRAQAGSNLSQIEAAKRAEPLRWQAKAREETALAADLIGFGRAFDERQTARRSGGLGAVTAQGRLDDFDAATQAAIEAAPEDRRPRLAATLASRRADEFAAGQREQDAATNGLIAQTATQGLDTLSNTLLSNPGAYAEAKALLPRLSAGIADPTFRAKFETEARGQVAASFVQGLINEGQFGTARNLLDGGHLDGDLDPARKQQYIAQLEVAARVGARRLRIAGGGSGDEDDGDGGGWGGVGLPAGPSFDNLKSGYASDPIKYAVKKGLAPVQAMDPNAGLQAGAGAGDWGQALQQRRAVGMEMHRADGVPQRMLSNPEVSFYKETFERDPTARYRVAEEARKAIGGQGAQDLLREIGVGDDAPVTVMIAHLAAGGSRKFAADAQRGVSLKAQGADLTAAEKRSLRAGFEPYRASFSAVPETLLAAQQAAEAAYIADKASGTLAQPDYYALRALGGVRVNDTTYGGGTTMRRQATVLPGWLNPDYADDALRTLGEVWAKGEQGPRFANGQPMTAGQIGRLALKLTPSGWYQLVNDKGQAALQKNGAPFMFDPDANRAFLAKRLGGKAVLGTR